MDCRNDYKWYLYKFYDIWLIKFLESGLRLIKFILMPLMPVVASKAIFEEGEKKSSRYNNRLYIKTVCFSR